MRTEFSVPCPRKRFGTLPRTGSCDSSAGVVKMRRQYCTRSYLSEMSHSPVPWPACVQCVSVLVWPQRRSCGGCRAAPPPGGRSGRPGADPPRARRGRARPPGTCCGASVTRATRRCDVSSGTATRTRRSVTMTRCVVRRVWSLNLTLISSVSKRRRRAQKLVQGCVFLVGWL